MNEERRRAEARELAEARYAFRWNLVLYLIVNPALVGLWYFTGPYLGNPVFPWPVFPIVFWGLGVAAHYWGAYRSGGDWITRETERILRDEDGRNP
ncbi:MAG: 2TM domain-containing protein [Thermoplasmata archaeon]|nr:2TM domain-containing protein [Thermoplasmata archaeon]